MSWKEAERYSDCFMAKPRPSKAIKIGGRSCFSVEGSVSSAQRSWKTGQAISESWAPRSERREREMLDWRGMGKDSGGGRERDIVARIGLARMMAERKVDR